MRRNKRVVQVGGIKVGGDNPVVVKGMLKSSLNDPERVIGEASRLEKEGCEIIRVAFERKSHSGVVKRIKKTVSVPLEADVHFDYRLALSALDLGIDALRLNPMNIYKKKEIREVVRAALINKVPIRVGINSGGFRKRVSDKQLSDLMLNKISGYVRFMEKEGFKNIMLSAKTHSLSSTVLVNRSLYRKFPYPLHLGLTASGPYTEGLIKSSSALGILLYEGIGDAVRLSLNADSFEEVKAAKILLQGVSLRRFSPEIISCPTCSRCRVDLKGKVEKFKEILYKNRNSFYNKDISIALMGCPVNGPGEAVSADIGIAFGKGYGMLFKKGEVLRRVREEEALGILLKYIEVSH